MDSVSRRGMLLGAAALGGLSLAGCVCPCHGSEFSATDGSVRKGPATKPLSAANITVDAGQIRLLD